MCLEPRTTVLIKNLVNCMKIPSAILTTLETHLTVNRDQDSLSKSERLLAFGDARSILQLLYQHVSPNIMQ